MRAVYSVLLVVAWIIWLRNGHDSLARAYLLYLQVVAILKTARGLRNSLQYFTIFFFKLKVSKIRYYKNNILRYIFKVHVKQHLHKILVNVVNDSHHSNAHTYLYYLIHHRIPSKARKTAKRVMWSRLEHFLTQHDTNVFAIPVSRMFLPIETRVMSFQGLSMHSLVSIC